MTYNACDKHFPGRAVMPWGKYKGVRIRLIPDGYLSFLTTLPLLFDRKWKWLKDSLDSELRFRGLRADLAGTPDPPPQEIKEEPIRRIDLE